MLLAANESGAQAFSTLEAATAVVAGLGSIGLSALVRGMLDMAADWNQGAARHVLRTGEVVMAALAAAGIVTLERTPGLAPLGVALAVAGYCIGEIARRFANRAIANEGGRLVTWYSVPMLFGAVVIVAALACRL